jgi:outer membrane protein TolC
LKNLYLLILFIISLTKQLPADEDKKECTGSIRLQMAINCVLEHSPEYKFAILEMKSFQGKKQTSAYLFPSNPILSVSNSHRTGNVSSGIIGNSLEKSVNGEIAVWQEIHLNSQRSLRMSIVDTEISGQTAKIKVVERDTIAEAIRSSITYEYSKLILAETKNFYEIALFIHKVIQKRVETGLLPPIDGDLAESELIKSFKLFQDATRNLKRAKANLTVMMGVPVDADLEITDIPTDIHLSKDDYKEIIEYAMNNRPEVYLKESDIISWKKKSELLHMEKMPNLTLGGFVQKDGFNENVIGARISLPLKVWRNNSGEITESQAKTEQAVSLLEVQKHTIKLEVAKAIADYKSLREEGEKFSPQLLQRVDMSLNGIKKGISAGQVQIRDTLLTQQSLVQLKLSYLETYKNRLLAGVELMRAGGLPFLKTGN